MCTQIRNRHYGCGIMGVSFETLAMSLLLSEVRMASFSMRAAGGCSNFLDVVWLFFLSIFFLLKLLLYVVDGFDQWHHMIRWIHLNVSVKSGG